MINNMQLISKDFTVNAVTGEAYISQRKAGELLGVAKTTLQNYLVSDHPNFNRINGLTPEILQITTLHFALNAKTTTAEAKELLHKLSTAGAKAFIYHEAGYTIQAVPMQPKSPIELAQENVAQAQAMLELIVNQEKMKLELVMKQEIIDQKLIVTNENPDYKTVSTVRKLDPDGVYDGNALTRKRIELGLPHSQLYAPEGYPTVNTYHVDVWNATYPHLEF